MKRQIQHIVIPINIWEHPDLTPAEKMVLCDIESYCINGETTVGAQAIASGCGMSTKEVKTALKSLQEKGGISVRLGENGEKLVTPYLYKERYLSSPENVVKVGTTPTDVLSLPWDEIAEKWKEYCPHLPVIDRWTPQRKSKLRSVMKNAGLNLEQLYKCFRIVGVTQFLNGTGEFKATFQWVTSKSENLQKVYEGFYARSFSEKSDYDRIMNGGEVSQKSKQEDNYYR